MNTITLIGLSTIFFYSVIQVLKFFSVNEDVYVPYILFYIFVIVCIIVLPHDNQKF